VAFAAAPACLREQQNLERSVRAVGLRHRCGADKGPGCNPLDPDLDHSGHCVILGKLHRERFTGTRAQLQVQPIERDDVAANACVGAAGTCAKTAPARQHESKQANLTAWGIVSSSSW
jgi:hypothetical protein